MNRIWNQIWVNQIWTHTIWAPQTEPNLESRIWTGTKLTQISPNLDTHHLGKSNLGNQIWTHTICRESRLAMKRRCVTAPPRRVPNCVNDRLGQPRTLWLACSHTGSSTQRVARSVSRSAHAAGPSTSARTLEGVRLCTYPGCPQHRSRGDSRAVGQPSFLRLKSRRGSGLLGTGVPQNTLPSACAPSWCVSENSRCLGAYRFPFVASTLSAQTCAHGHLIPPDTSHPVASAHRADICHNSAVPKIVISGCIGTV